MRTYKCQWCSYPFVATARRSYCHGCESKVKEAEKQARAEKRLARKLGYEDSSLWERDGRPQTMEEAAKAKAETARFFAELYS